MLPVQLVEKLQPGEFGLAYSQRVCQLAVCLNVQQNIIQVALM